MLQSSRAVFESIQKSTVQPLNASQVRWNGRGAQHQIHLRSGLRETQVFLATAGSGIDGCFALADTLRPDAAATVQGLQDMGLKIQVPGATANSIQHDI